MSVQMRASDDDRQRIIDVLQQHTTAGRLTLDEFSERVGDVYSARTMGDLIAVTHDLPVTPGEALVGTGAVDTAPSHNRERHELLALFAVAAAALVLLGLLMTLR